MIFFEMSPSIVVVFFSEFLFLMLPCWVHLWKYIARDEWMQTFAVCTEWNKMKYTVNIYIADR